MAEAFFAGAGAGGAIWFPLPPMNELLTL